MGKEQHLHTMKAEVPIIFLQYVFCFPFYGKHTETLWLWLPTFCLAVYIRKKSFPKIS